MKKLFLTIAAVFVFLMNIVPFAAYADNYGTILDNFCAEYPYTRDDNNFYYISFCHNYEIFGGNMFYDEVIRISKNCSITEVNDGFRIERVNENDIIIYEKKRDEGGWNNGKYLDWVSVSSEHKVVYYVSASGRTYGNDWNTIDYYDTINSSEVFMDIDVEFNPQLVGEVTRTEIIDGRSFTSDNLEMTITNNTSKKVQFFMSFVYTGQECVFPTMSNNATFEELKKGYTNNSIYTYVTDEWLGMSQSSIISSLPNLSQNFGYSPSAWHTIQPHDTETYNIPWEAMKLAKNTNYDCVVYACWNNVDLQGTNYSGVSVSGVTEAVDLMLDDIVEVYRSSFTMKDPAKFNPNTEGVHAWDNTEDNSDYFNKVKAYTDKNGNLIIKDQIYDSNGNFIGGNGYTEKSNFESNSNTKNFRNSYNSFIGFVSYIFNRFPADVKNIYKYSFLGICVLGIIKKVT